MADERRVVTSSMALQVGDGAWGQHHHRVKNLIVQNPGSGEAVARKLAEAPYNKKDLHRSVIMENLIVAVLVRQLSSRRPVTVFTRAHR
jgi:hypothetical protein